MKATDGGVLTITQSKYSKIYASNIFSLNGVSGIGGAILYDNSTKLIIEDPDILKGNSD